MRNRIVVDIGNSRIKAGVFEGDALKEVAHYPLAEVKEAIEDIHKRAEAIGTKEIALCSVVEGALDTLRTDLSGKGYKVFEVTPASQTIISGVYDTLGPDRIANLAAGLKLFAARDGVIVLDVGTATTLTACDSRGKFLGGMITLGLGKTLDGLHAFTDQLPELRLTESTSVISPLAQDTESAILSGVVLAQAGALAEWVEKVRRKLQSKPTVVATGGWARFISSYATIIEQVEPNLTLLGINLIAEEATALRDRA